MASDHSEHVGLSFALEPAIHDWLDEHASRRGERVDEFCRHLLYAVYATSADDSHEVPDPGRVDALEERLDTQRAAFHDGLEDVRERVVEVSWELERHRADDGDDPHVTPDALDALEARLESLAADLDAGFDNYETVLERGIDERETLAGRQRTLATALLEVRDHVETIRVRSDRRAKADALKLAANRLGLERAACEACDSSVSISLLTEPTCPHCEATLVDVETRSSLFGSHTLRTGEPPALEGGVETAADALEFEFADGDGSRTETADDGGEIDG
ncbi:hypothetical protein [Natronobiforma cellulositropha]|uniref:hypothetical protein n=1 Tax=Natronobiforma cellulositropha TaxID=1679076 RepID=UPI0021D5D159|nr:hypothetical protein [Natronobiforma cellulositropha]